MLLKGKKRKPRTLKPLGNLKYMIPGSFDKYHIKHLNIQEAYEEGL